MNDTTQRRTTGSCLQRFLAVALVIWLGSAYAQDADQLITPNFQDTDIRTVTQSVMDVTGRNVIIDPRINARVTLFSNTPVNPAGFYELYLAALQVHGYAAVENDNTVRVIPDATARQVPSEDSSVIDAFVTRTIRVDVRIIAATHRDLEAEVHKGSFRRDLFYRLDVIPLNIPALRNRKSDLPLLIKHFLNQINATHRREVKTVSTEAIQILLAHCWPGNVRELRNLVERMVVLRADGEIGVEDLPEKLRNNKSTVPIQGADFTDEGICLNTAVTEFEKALIIQSLEKTKWIKNQAAKLLQLNRTTLVEKIKRHKICRPEA